MNKKVLNESQLRNEIIKHLLENKVVLSRKEAEKMLDEGFMDKIKQGMANAWEKTKHVVGHKIGTITAGGKYFGQTKAKLAAQSQIDAELAKKGNKSIRDLDKTLKTQFPGFPSVEKKEQFIAGVEAIGQVYESIVAATKLKPGTKGYLSPKRANNIIKTLRMYVQKLIDYDLISMYRTFNENDEKYYQENQHLLFEAGPLTGTKETETEKVYKSNVAPLTLVGIGTALGAFSWLVNTDWFKNLFAVKKSVPVTQWMTQDTQKVLGTVKSGDGLTQTLNKFYTSKLSAGSSPEEFVNALAKVGGGNAAKGAELLTQKGGMLQVPGARDVLMDIIKDPNGKGDTLGAIFKGKLAGTGKEIGDILVTQPGSAIFGVIKAAVPKIALMTTVKIGAGYAAAKGLGGILGPIGIGLVAAGALVKGLRMKGLKSSRMATLKNLLVNINDVPVPAQKPETKNTDKLKAAKNTNIKQPNSKKSSTAEPEANQTKADQPAISTKFNYTQPGSDKTSASYTVKGTAPTFGTTSSTTSKSSQPTPQPETGTSTEPAAPKAKVTKKKPATKKTGETKSKKTKAGSEESSTTTPKTVSAKPTGSTDYKRSNIGFNRNLAEAFKTVINVLNKKRLL